MSAGTPIRSAARQLKAARLGEAGEQRRIETDIRRPDVMVEVSNDAHLVWLAIDAGVLTPQTFRDEP